MNRKLMFAFALLISSAAFNSALAQGTDTVNVGIVTGLLRDSVHNYVLQSATLSIYKVKDNELVSYQLSNNFGKYQFKQMPVGIPLRMIATHIGYISGKAEFTISPKTKTTDLKTINLQRIDLSLKEVVINADVAPMQMHGDTLEFNAAAFKLDTNAVVEDLLRKLPGVTVWSDGIITVNGKKINRLLVEGKDLFGGNNKIALQNIPKNAVKKIQVYQDKNDKDPVNPKTDMNIVLKNDRKDGFFGKFGGGYGTDKRYASDGMITYYSPKTQFSLVGAANNVNKTATDVNTLMGFNSFKGEGLNNDYHSDFRQQGLNVYKGTGFTVSHDLSKDADTREPYYKTNMIKGEFFVNDGSNKTLQDAQTTVSLGANEHLDQKANGTSTSDNYGLRSNANYEKRYEHSYLYTSFSLSDTKNNSVNTQNNTSVDDLTLQQTQSFAQQTASGTQNNFDGNIRANTDRYYDFVKRKHRSLSTEWTYDIHINNGTSDSKNITDFKATDASQNKYFNRHYLTDYQSTSHAVNTTIKDILGLLRKRGASIKMDVVNNLTISDRKENNDVSDLSASSSTQYTPNTDLTNVSHYKTVDEKTGLSFSKSYTRYLDNRFYKYWEITAFAQNQFFMQRNSALQSQQNLNRSYYYFIPSININYNNSQYGDFQKNYGLSYTTSVEYNTIAQLAPLIDNANVYSVTIGNPYLRPAYKHDVTFRYTYYDQYSKNAYYGNLSVSAGYVEHNIVDSVNYDALGRTVRRYINGSGGKYVNYYGYINKVLKIKDHQLQLSGNSGANYSGYTSAVNGQYYDSHSSSLNISANATYTYKSNWSAGVGEYFSGNKTSQGSLSNLTYYNWATDVGVAFAFPKSIFFDTRLNFNNSKVSSAANNIYYTIWNADIGYRFLKGSTAEIKLSALDLLHQNKAIYNYVNGNSITTSTVNVLQQYFMLTLAYYPRKFGLGKK